MNFRKHLVKRILERKISHIVMLNKPKEIDYCSLACSKCYGHFKITEVTPRTMVSFTFEEALSYGYDSLSSLLNQAQQRGDLSLKDSKTSVYLCKIELLDKTEEGNKLLKPIVPKKKRKYGRKEVIAYWKGKCPQCKEDYMKLKKHWKTKTGLYLKCESCGYKEDYYKPLTSKDLCVIDSKGNPIMEFCQVCGTRVFPRKKPKGKGYYYFCSKCKKKSHDVPKECKVFYR